MVSSDTTLVWVLSDLFVLLFTGDSPYEQVIVIGSPRLSIPDKRKMS